MQRFERLIVTAVVFMSCLTTLVQADEAMDKLLDIEKQYNSHRHAGEFAAAEEWARQAHQLTEASFANNARLRSVSAQWIGICCTRQAKYDEAEKYFLLAVRYLDADSPPDHAELVNAYTNLTILYQNSTNQVEKADAAATRLLEVSRKAFPADHPKVGSALTTLANVRLDQSKFAAGDKLNQQALAILQRHASSEPELYAQALVTAAEARASLGQHEAAVTAYRQTLTIMRQIYPAAHTNIAHALTGLGNVELDLGHNEAALVAHQEALEVREELSGQQSADVADVLNNMANVYHAQGNYDECEKVRRQVVAIYEQAVTADPDNKTGAKNKLATGLMSLASICDDILKYREAEALFHRSLEIYENLQPPAPVDAAIAYNNLSVLYFDLCRYEESKQANQRSLVLTKAVFGEEHPEYALVLRNFGGGLAIQGDSAGAIAPIERALAIFEQSYGEEHWHIASTCQALCQAYWDVGRYGEAQSTAQRALRVAERTQGQDHPDLIPKLAWTAKAATLHGRPGEAIAHLERALKIAEKRLTPDHPHRSWVMSELAVEYAAQGRHQKAVKLGQQALTNTKKHVGEFHIITAQGCGALAEVYFENGDYAEAIRYREMQREITAKVTGTESVNFAHTITCRAIAEEKLQDYKKAEQSATEVLLICEKGHRVIGQFDAYHIRAKARIGLDDHAGAQADLNRAMDLAEQQRANFGGGEHGKSAAFTHAFAEAYETAIAWHAKAGDTAQAFAAMERNRARGLQNLMAVQGVDLLEGVDKKKATALRQRETRAQAAIVETQKRMELLFERKDLTDGEREKSRKELANQHSQAQEEYVEAYAAVRAASPAYQLALTDDKQLVSLATVKELASQQNALVLQYVSAEEHTYVLVISPTGAWMQTLELDRAQADVLAAESGPLTADKLTQLLNEDDGVLQLLRKSKQADAQKSAQRKLAALWKVLIPKEQRSAIEAGEFKRLVIIPDGPLASLPLETLVVTDEDEVKYLLDIGPPIIYVPSATIWVNLLKRHKGTTKSLAPVLSVGDPAYGSGDGQGDRGTRDELARFQPGARYHTLGGQLLRLPFTAWETAWVKQVFAKHGIASTQLQRGEATEARVRRELAGRDVVHLACHGMVDQSHGNLFGALALSPSENQKNLPSDDGFLTLAEIYNLDLSGCELAILSACDTNFGPQQRGEGVWSLSRGFLVAGSRRVVASNWLVDDKAAASLMSYYCAIIANGQANAETTPDYADALHQAKKWVRNQNSWSSPYYWGTFVLVGPN